MDTLTHALSGALLARATAPGGATGAQRLKRVVAGFLACAAPDLDFVVGFLGPVRYLELHRGVSHSLLLLPAWAWLLSWLLAALLRDRRGWRAYFGVTGMGLAAHIAGDVITSFGTMVLAPTGPLPMVRGGAGVRRRDGRLHACGSSTCVSSPRPRRDAVQLRRLPRR